MTNNNTTTPPPQPPPQPPFPQLLHQEKEECFYALLNVPRDTATVAQIQRHFKLLSRIYHPDKCANNIAVVTVTTTSTTSTTTSSRNDDDNSTATTTNEISLADDDDEKVPLLRMQQQQAAAAAASTTFVRLKTAADVLSDPVYRAAYNHGGTLAVMLIQRSQSLYQAASTAHTNHGDDHETNDDDDKAATTTTRNLYTELEQTLHYENDDDDEQTTAADMIHDLILSYRLEQEQKSWSQQQSSPLEVSCSLPYILTKNVPLYGVMNDSSQLQRDSASVTVRSKTALSSNNALWSVTWSTTSHLQRTAQTALTSSVGCDWQPVAAATRNGGGGGGGTRFRAEVAAPHNQNLQSPVQWSVQSTRQTATGTVLVAMLGGTWHKWTSWNATFLSSKVLQWEPMWRRKQPRRRRRRRPSHDDEYDHDHDAAPTKVLATWRISCSPVTGQLRHFQASVKRFGAYPQWAIRLAAAGPAFPLKLVWQSADETNACCWRVSYSCGWFMSSRIKLVRIARLGVGDDNADSALSSSSSSSSSNPWTITYGLKYDGQAPLLAGGQPLWSIVLHVHSDYLSLRIPIGLELISPVAWMASFLCAELVDQLLQQVSFRWMLPQRMRNGNDSSGWDKRHMYPPVRTNTTRTSCGWSNVIANVAAKKRAHELSLDHGLVVRRAIWRTGQRIDHDVTDTLQFWIVDGRLHPVSMKDSRLWWELNQVPEPTAESKDNGRSWWDFLLRRNRSNESEEAATRPNEDYSLTIRYQLRRTIYEVYLTGSDLIQLPHPNATELGPADRVS
jgi:curved DNA-binding protein CbpA